MYHQQVIRSIFNEFYIIIPSWRFDASTGIQPVDFWGLESTRTFLSTWMASDRYWEDILGLLGMSAGQNRNETNIAISRALLNRQLLACPVMPPQLNPTGQAARTLEQDNTIYQIRHPSLALFETPQRKQFTDQQEAEAFLRQFELDSDTLSDLILEGDWENNPAVWDKDRQIKKLAELIVAGKMIITQRRAPEPPKAKSTTAPVPGDIGQRSAGLGPEGLHNQEWDKVEVKKDSFKTAKEVDMDDLAEDEKIAAKALERQGWDGKKIKEILNSGDHFTTRELEADTKLYGFGSSGYHPRTKSAYWLDETGLKKIQAEHYKNGQWDRQGVKETLALPCKNRANALDMVEVTEKQVVVKSRIVPAKETTRYFRNQHIIETQQTMHGGGTQITPAPGELGKVTRLW